MSTEPLSSAAPETPSKPLTWGDLSREADQIQARLMKLSKECLGLALSTMIADRAFLLHGPMKRVAVPAQTWRSSVSRSGGRWRA